MRMTLGEYRARFPQRPEPAPLKFAGQWVAWDAKRSRIVAHGPELAAVHRDALAAGHSTPVLQRVLGSAFIGGA
jgi:hypothetical protein